MLDLDVFILVLTVDLEEHSFLKFLIPHQAILHEHWAVLHEDAPHKMGALKPYPRIDLVI